MKIKQFQKCEKELSSLEGPVKVQLGELIIIVLVLDVLWLYL